MPRLSGIARPAQLDRKRAERSTFALALVLAGCSFAPTHERPVAPIAAEFPDATSGPAAADLGWRAVFAEPRLQALIALALHDNRDLRIAALEVELTRAQYQIQRAPLLPQLAGVTSADARGGVNPFAPNLPPQTFVIYRLGGSLSYEIDLFGRVRNQRTAALEQYLASAEARRATQLALVGQIAIQYLRERAYAEQRDIAAATVQATEEAYEMTVRALDVGQRSELDVRTAEAQVETARGEVARLTRLHAQAEVVLVQLVGSPLPTDLPAPRPLETLAITELGAGVPSEVLVRRPDVLAAEHALRAANANIGVARAAFFPSISLTSFAGLASNALGNLFRAGSYAWSVSPQLSVPLFDHGRNRATLEVAEIRKLIEVARYERAIQVAFREVAEALAARATLDEQLAAQERRTAAEQRRYELSQTRYQNGIESYLAVLTAQQGLYVSQQLLVELRFLRLANLADLYRALGGGWRE
jgi:outer membrane protein, multidrug efflux system